MVPWTVACQVPRPWDSPGKNTRASCHPFSRGSSWPRDQAWVSCIAGRFLTIWATGEAYTHRHVRAHSHSHGRRAGSCPHALWLQRVLAVIRDTKLVSGRHITSAEGWRWAIVCVPWVRCEGGLPYVGQRPAVTSLEGYRASISMLRNLKLSKLLIIFMVENFSDSLNVSYPILVLYFVFMTIGKVFLSFVLSRWLLKNLSEQPPESFLPLFSLLIFLTINSWDSMDEAQD